MPNGKESVALTEAVFYILLSLYQPMHGYGIMQNVGRLSGGRVNLAAGTLYGALTTLLERGWIRALPEDRDSRKKEYAITDAGRLTAQAELLRLKELVANGCEILGRDGQ
jgi:DNA-binding PadR family transcriptional regulator